MKYIAAEGINSAYSRSKDIVLFDDDKTSKRTILRHRFAYESKSKK